VRTSCPVCEGDRLFVFLERNGVPVHLNFLVRTEDAARAIPRGDLRLACCESCGFITNLAFRSELLRYRDAYESDRSQSPVFEGHVSRLVSRLVDTGVRKKFVIEIACGQGEFLTHLCEAGDNRGLGFDPSYMGQDSLEGARVTFRRDFFRRQCVREAADVVICRHLLGHLPDPMTFLREASGVLREGSGMLSFEIADVDWSLRHTVVQDFFYEYCSYFTEASLRFACERAGFSRFEVSREFGSQYLWIDSHTEGTLPAARSPAPGETQKSARHYQESEPAKLKQWRQVLERVGAKGPVAIWGAGGKGATFANLMDPTRELVDCVVDVNSRRRGSFIPGTRHPVVSPHELRARGVRQVLVMNPNYTEEIRAACDPDIEVHNEGAP
jgi:SAM-dependent methyltransferase